jgi:hypothetical protein
MNKDHGWIVCAANDKIDMVLIIRHVTAPRPDLSFLCAAYATTVAPPKMCIAIRCQIAQLAEFGKRQPRKIRPHPESSTGFRRSAQKPKGCEEPETTSIEIMGSAVNRVKDRIAAPSTILIGHSMGCRVVIDAFQQSGVTVAGLVFVDGSILGCDLQLTMNNTKAAIDRAGMDAFTQQFFSDMFLESGDPELRERLIARAQGLNARFREELFLEVARWDATKLRDALRRISVRHSFYNPLIWMPI